MQTDAKDRPEYPVLDYAHIEAEYLERGIRLRDMMKSDGHFYRWRQKKGLPKEDEEGKDEGSSRLYMKMYQEDPNGEGSRPPHVDFWHWLLERFETIPWRESRSERTKVVPITAGAFPAIPAMTQDALRQARLRVEAKVGSPLDDEMWAPTERMLKERPLCHQKGLEIMTEIAERHGVDLGHGKAIGLKLRIGR